MSTAGALHCAESEKWMAAQEERKDEASVSAGVSGCSDEAPALATAPLYEVAAAHDGQPAVPWLLAFYRLYGERD